MSLRKLNQTQWQVYKWAEGKETDNLLQFLEKELPESIVDRIKKKHIAVEEAETEEEVKGCKDKDYKEYNRDATIDDQSFCKTKKIK